jgi:regulator of replication initiation timing
MDVLKQLEQKVQALVAQRNNLKEELERVNAEHGGLGAEAQQLRRSLEDARAENAVLLKERNDVRQQVESILRQLEALS